MGVKLKHRRVITISGPRRRKLVESEVLPPYKERTHLSYAKELLANRFCEKKGCYYLDDRPATIWQIIHAANIILDAKRMPLIKLERIK
jgi:hypothetical protein